MNKTMLMGRFTKDPDVRYSAGNGGEQNCFARFTLAVDRRRTNSNGEREADFIGCVAFGKQAEFIEKYMHQGSKVALTGRLQTGSYEREGKRIYTTDVVVEDIEFAESKASSEQRAGTAPAAQAPAQGYMPQAPAPTYAPQAPAQGYVPQAPAPSYAPQAPAPAYVPQTPAPAAPQAPAQGQPTTYAPEQAAQAIAAMQQGAPAAQESQVGQGFMNIPEGVEDEGLPFN